MTHEAILVRGEDDFHDLLAEELGAVFSRSDSVAVKLHMGEPGNTTHIEPRLAARIVDVLARIGCAPFLFDTPVVYASPRGSEAGYRESARRNGFSQGSIGAPVVISDRSVQAAGRHMTYGVASAPLEADGVLLLSHFKGHICTGIGASLKNAGMGCVSKATKGAIHDGGEPVYQGGCTECGLCAENCPTGNVRLEGGRPFFDATWCPGCSNCVLSCPEGCLAPRTAVFDTLLAEAAVSACRGFGKTYSVNVMKKMTRLCDCVADAGPLVAGDVGYVCGRGMTAVDAAALEILARETGAPDLFQQHNRKSSWLHVREAARMDGTRLPVSIREVRR